MIFVDFWVIMATKKKKHVQYRRTNLQAKNRILIETHNIAFCILYE